MNPRDHRKLVENLKLNGRAKLALHGHIPDPGKEIAALLRSGAPISKPVRELLADMLDCRAAKFQRPVAQIRGAGHKTKKAKFQKRLDHLRRAAAFDDCPGLSTEEFAAREGVGASTLDRSLAYARTFIRWRATLAPDEFLSPERIGLDIDTWEQFLREQFVFWLLENPHEEPRI